MAGPKDEFIKQAIRILRRDGFKQKTLEWVLKACWSHGASMALLLPGIVDKTLEKHDREAFAAEVINVICIDLFKSSGLTRKEIETMAAEIREREACLPVISLSAEIDWLVGQRSVN